MTVTDLRQRIAAADGPSRELDASIWAHFAGREVYRVDGNLLARSLRPPHDECLIGRWFALDNRERFDCALYVPPFTAFLDAAVALVERVLPEANCYGLDFNPQDGWMAYVSRNYVEKSETWLKEAYAPTAPLAVLKALIMALEAKSERAPAAL